MGSDGSRGFDTLLVLPYYLLVCFFFFFELSELAPDSVRFVLY